MRNPNYELFDHLCATHELNPNDIATELKISHSTLTHWKYQRSMPKYDVVARIANYFDIPADAFYLNKTFDLGEYVSKAIKLMDLMQITTWNGNVMTTSQKESFRAIFNLLNDGCNNICSQNSSDS